MRACDQTPDQTPNQPATVGTTRVRRAAVLLWIVAFSIGAMWIARVPLGLFPVSGDEYSYLFQAKVFARGQLASPAPPEDVRDAFLLEHTIADERVRSKYPPGWPMVLAIGERLGASWLVAPVVSAFTLWFLFCVIVRLHGRASAWIAIVAIAISPFFAFNAASYHSHAASLLCVSVAFHALVCNHFARRRWLSMVTGVSMGLMFLIRPLDAVVAGLALAWLIPWRHVKDVACMAASALPFVALFLLYNAWQFGDPLVTGYDLYRPIHRALYGAVDDELSLAHIGRWNMHLGWVTALVHWIVPGFVLLVPVGIAYRLHRDEYRAPVWSLVTLLVLLFAISHVLPSGGDGYGPRYLYLSILPIAVFGSSGAVWMFEYAGRRTRVLVLLMAAALMFASVKRISTSSTYYHRHVEARSSLFRLAARLPQPSIILLRATPWFGPRWYTRNEPGFQARVLYAIDGPQIRASLPTLYPERAVYVYDRWVLSELDM